MQIDRLAIAAAAGDLKSCAGCDPCAFESVDEGIDEGAPLAGMVHGGLRLDLKLFTLGGLSVLVLIRAQDYDTLSRRPRGGKLKKLRLMARAFAGLTAQHAFGRRGRG